MGPPILFLLSLLLLWCLPTASQAYNATQASILARYSKAAYYPRASLQSWTCPSAYCLWHVQNIIVFSGEKYDLQGFTAYCASLQKIVVVIRGTVRKNWLQNFQAIKEDYGSMCEKCKVHSGFSKHANSLEKGALEAVSKLVQQYPNAEILLGGHSLGGALAQLLGLKIKRNFNVTTTLYTFGSPRVGNNGLAQFSDKTFKGHFRVVNSKDAVPHVLPRSFGFRHGGTEIWYKSWGKMMVCPGDQSRKCSNSLYLMLLIDCHDLVRYITLLTPKRSSQGKGDELAISGVQLAPKKNLKSSAPVVLLDKLEGSEAPRQQVEEVEVEDIDGLQGYEVYAFLTKYEDGKGIGELAD